MKRRFKVVSYVLLVMFLLSAVHSPMLGSYGVDAVSAATNEA